MWWWPKTDPKGAWVKRVEHFRSLYGGHVSSADGLLLPEGHRWHFSSSSIHFTGIASCCPNRSYLSHWGDHCALQLLEESPKFDKQNMKWRDAIERDWRIISISWHLSVLLILLHPSLRGLRHVTPHDVVESTYEIDEAQGRADTAVTGWKQGPQFIMTVRCSSLN